MMEGHRQLASIARASSAAGSRGWGRAGIASAVREVVWMKTSAGMPACSFRSPASRSASGGTWMCASSTARRSRLVDQPVGRDVDHLALHGRRGALPEGGEAHVGLRAACARS